MPRMIPAFSAAVRVWILEGSVLTVSSVGCSVDDASLELSPLGVGEVVGGVGDPDFGCTLSRNCFRNWSVEEVILDYRSQEER